MIEELLIALSGYPGDLFYPPSVGTVQNCGDNVESRCWQIAPELRDVLHPGEEELLSKLLLLSSYVANLEHYVESYGSLEFFSRIITSSANRTCGPVDIQNGAESTNFMRSNDLLSIGAYAASLSEGFSSILENYRSQLVELEKTLCNYSYEDAANIQRTSKALIIYGELQPYYRIFPVLDRLQTACASDENKLRNGGEILSMLCRVYESERADHLVKAELEILLRRCLTTFRNHLMQWLATGRVTTDRFDEFFIRAPADEATGAAIIRKEYLPQFVSEALAQKVLFIGKSVKMMLESSTSSLQAALEEWEQHLTPLWSLMRSFSLGGCSESTNFQYDDLAFELERNVEVIRRAAAEKLYLYCFEQAKAKNALEAWIKNAFFLGKGELFLAFIDAGESHFSSAFPIDQSFVSSQCSPFISNQPDNKTILLSKCWTTAMEKIYWENDEEREFFSRLVPHFVYDQLERTKAAWNAINLRLELPKRLSPIFTPTFVADLNTIFRFLLRWRRTQASIESCWFTLKKSPSHVTRSLPNLEKIQQLILLMLFVVKNFQYYIHADVLETVFAQMTNELSSCRDFEHVLKTLHSDLIDRVSSQCFLTGEGTRGDTWQAKVGKILSNFGDECDKFSALVLCRLRGVEVSDKELSNSAISSPNTPSDANCKFAAQLHESYVKAQRKTALLFKLLSTCKVHDKSACLSHLLLRLDFNDYFSSTEMFSVSK